MNKISIQAYNSPLGEIILGVYENNLCLCDWKHRKMRSRIDQRLQQGLNANYIEKKTVISEQAIEQLNEYFEGKREKFDLQLLTVGTDFQKTVWEELLKVPYGKTITYLELSKKLGNKKAIRAVASANGANAISIIIPCHRIIGSKGALTGYAGGLPAKKKLITLETGEEQLKFFE